MNRAVQKQIKQLIEEGSGLESVPEINRWILKVGTFLRSGCGVTQADEFQQFHGITEYDTLAMGLGYLEGILVKGIEELAKTRLKKIGMSTLQQNPSQVITTDTKRVFVVHGHDEAAKEATARFLEKLGLQPVILHEQASGGRTIIEKFEIYSGDVCFAVILLTPDDVGAAEGAADKLCHRARQNVVLELGYFMGRLTRNRVCALYKGGVELPSDIQGVIYVEMDENGAWKTKLAQEFVQAKISININAILGA
jgi:predicted nucleotide-binding protein